MINYHTGLVLKIDIALLALYLAFAMLLVTYLIIRNHRSENRLRKLLKIKQDIFGSLLKGKRGETCPALISRATSREFVDVRTNRLKHTVFFNESEQQLFKDCFVSADKIKALESSAKKRRGRWRRIEAIMALGYIQAESSPEILRELLYSKDDEISYFSALAIGRIGTQASAGILMRFLKERPRLRRKIASILESLNPGVTEEVIKFADDPEPDVRAWAARLLAKSVSKEYIKKVEALTEDESPDVRAASCESLAKLNDKDSKKILTKRLKDDTWFVRMHAVRAISKIFGKDAISEIFTLLNDGSILVLEGVKRAMADNIDAALPYIHKILAGDDEPAKKVCKEALSLSDLEKI